MEFSQQLEIWAKGDAMQGRIMFGLGVLLLVAFVFILRGDSSLLKGMLIPIGLLLAVNLGYGGFLSYSRPGHIVITSEAYSRTPDATVKKEFEKANRDHRIYSTAKRVWGVLIVVCVGLFFFFSGEYLQGLSLGLLGMFVWILLIDVFLHHRLQPYLEVLKQLGGG